MYDLQTLISNAALRGQVAVVPTAKGKVMKTESSAIKHGLSEVGSGKEETAKCPAVNKRLNDH